MQPEEGPGIQVERDLRNLTRTLTSDNLDISIMFAPRRGIRACTPPFGTTSKSSVSVSERLKRIRMPAE